MCVCVGSQSCDSVPVPFPFLHSHSGLNDLVPDHLLGMFDENELEVCIPFTTNFCSKYDLGIKYSVVVMTYNTFNTSVVHVFLVEVPHVIMYKCTADMYSACIIYIIMMHILYLMYAN